MTSITAEAVPGIALVAEDRSSKSTAIRQLPRRRRGQPGYPDALAYRLREWLGWASTAWTG